MSEEDKTRLHSYLQKLDKDSEYSIPLEIIREQPDNYFSNLKVDNPDSVKQYAENAGIDMDEFSNSRRYILSEILQ